MKISAALLLWTSATIGSSNAFVSTTSKTIVARKKQQSSDHHIITTLSSPTTTNVGTYTKSFHQLHSQPSTTTTNTQSQDEQEEEDNLTPEKLAEMIEVSFIQSCLQLSQGYVDVLKLFIVAVKTAYETTQPRLSLTELHDLVKDCPVNSAGRELMREEVELRLEWMMVVYEMMGVLKRNKNDGPLLLDPEAIQSTTTDTTTTATDSSQARVTKALQSMLELQTQLQNEHEQSGGKQDVNVALTTQTIETAMEKLPSLSRLVNSMENPVEKAFLMNDVRVALLMFQVLEEERVCLEDSQGMKSSSGSGGVESRETIPRPPIKGT